MPWDRSGRLPSASVATTAPGLGLANSMQRSRTTVVPLAGSAPERKSDSKISGPSEKGAAVCKGVLFVSCGEYTSSQQPKPVARLPDRYNARPRAMRGSCSPLTVGPTCFFLRIPTNLAFGPGSAHRSAPTSRTFELNVDSRNEIRPDSWFPIDPRVDFIHVPSLCNRHSGQVCHESNHSLSA